MGLYRKLAENLFFNPHDVDETSLETLVEFIAWKDPDVRTKHGKTYKRASGVPTWL